MFQSRFLREMRAGEEDAVDALLRRAFGGADEATLVRRLRRAGDIAGECVVPGETAPLAYLALSSMRAPSGWLCLAPVAVEPDSQRRGIGRRAVGLVTAWAVAAGQTVVVLGDPAFYRRAGFSGARAQGLVSPYPISHTLIARPGEDTPTDTLVYPEAFAG
ncbi:GNAT family N-acetyltransferase [Roseivivax isoporae]|uniref:GNAT family acetyltransferase n=1 Tax=Roseivivax isoporae LMG 25204 TaxID=1449351 RepID=X7FBM0_9RHOB|nr:N-acetyltransferase [Roseivivax isoporae]ETX30103.1 GNAT family acetyltransferase [Roseivivax isoporae LMG 25204]